MPIPRALGLVLAAALTAAACSASESPPSTEAGGFLLAARTQDVGVSDECIDLADDFLAAVGEHISILGQRTFAEWVTTGLFHIEDESPEAAARLTAAAAGYADARCPQGYVAATIVAHGDRFDLKGPGAAIWWAGVVASSVPRLGEGAGDDAQAGAWLALAATSTRNLSSRAVVPDEAEIERLAGCDQLAPAATNLLQQQLYLVSAVQFAESFDEVLEPLKAASDRINQLRGFSDCDSPVREHLLRSAHDIEFAGANAVIAFATELHAAWTLWSEENLATRLDFGVDVLASDTGEAQVDVTNVGNIPIRLLSVELAGITVIDESLDLLPEQNIAVQVGLGEVPAEPVDLVVVLQTPTGGTETQRASVALGG